MTDDKKMESVDSVVDSLMEDLSEKPEVRKRRSWKWMDTPEKAKEFYCANYDGMSRSEVKKADSGFFDVVRKRDWLDLVLPSNPQSGNRDWTGIDCDSAAAYIEENYKGMTRNEIRELDAAFYAVLCRKGFLDVLPDSERQDWSDFDLARAKAIYETKYAGLTRTEVCRASRGFYAFVLKNGWQDDIFLERKTRDWSDFDVEKAKEYYEENLSGFSRKEVQDIDSSFKAMLDRRGWLDQVLPPSKHRDWSDIDLEGAKKFYEENYAGRSRTQVSKADNVFYKILCARGWLDDIFPPVQNRGNR